MKTLKWLNANNKLTNEHNVIVKFEGSTDRKHAKSRRG